MAGPVTAPLTVRENNPPDWNHLPRPDGKRKTSINPATRNAKVMPMATICR